MNSSQSMSGLPQTCDFLPTSLYVSLYLMPDLHSCSDFVTSSSVLPRQDVMPMPVTTTLLPFGAAICSSAARACEVRRRDVALGATKPLADSAKSIMLLHSA